MRVLKSLALRFCVVFSGCLLFTLFSEHFSSSGPTTMAVLDRRYQLTLDMLKSGTRKRPSEYGDFKIKSGRWTSVVNNTQCVTGVDASKVELRPCDMNSPQQNWTIYYSRTPDKRDKIVLGAVDKCIDQGAVSQPRGTPIILYGCHGGMSQELSYDFTSKMVYHGESNNCFEVQEGVLKSLPCSLKKQSQKFVINRTDGSD